MNDKLCVVGRSCYWPLVLLAARVVGLVKRKLEESIIPANQTPNTSRILADLPHMCGEASEYSPADHVESFTV